LGRPFPGRPTRRQLLLGGAASLLLAGCDDSSVQGSAKVTPAGAATKYTIDELFAAPSFYVAHRGSGDNWAEHTLQAYSHAAELGVKAIEISVNATRDGVLVCHHDTTLLRTTGHDLAIAQLTWSELSDHLVDARKWLGPSAQPQPIPRLDEVLELLGGSHVLFLEDKQGTNTTALLDRMDQQQGSQERFIWKQWVAAQQYRLARSRGYRTWGYFNRDLLGKPDRYVKELDYVGVHHSATDTQIEKLVDFGKPVIAWEVHTRAMRDRMARLGVSGYMCSNVPYVTRSDAAAQADTFGSGLRAAGDLPWSTDRGWGVQPGFDPLSQALTVRGEGVQSYVMGSMAPIVADTYTLATEMRWPDGLPGERDHGGIAFGQKDDQAYRVRVPSAQGGYHAILRTNGLLELFERAPGVVDATSLGVVKTDEVQAGQWVGLQVSVSPSKIIVRREGAERWAVTVDNSHYRGGYFSLCKNYRSDLPVQFRAVTVT